MTGTRLWDWLAGLILRRPGRVLALALLPLVLPLAALPSLRVTQDILSQLPDDAESVRGFEALNEHLPAGETAPIVLVVAAETSIYEPSAFRALGDLSRNLRRLPGVESVRSAAMPTDGRRPELPSEATEQITELAEGLREAADGARQLADGIRQVRDGLAEIDRRLPELAGGLAEAQDGAEQLLAGTGEARTGVAGLRSGTEQLRAGIAEARAGTVRLRDEVAVPADAALRRAVDAMQQFTVGRTDPRYPDAYEAVGEAYARVTGRFPPGHPQAGERVEPGYDGLVAALDELAAGLAEAEAGAGQLAGGLGELDAGLAGIEDGLRRLRDGLAEAGGGVGRLRAAIAALLAGIDQRLLPGADQLAVRLGEGAAEVAQADLASFTLGRDEGPFVVTPAMLEALPEIRDRSGFFVAADDTRTRVFVGLADSPFSPQSIATVNAVEEMARNSLLDSPLAEAEVAATGPSAFVRDVDRAAADDFPVIVAAVIAGVFVVVALLLRSLVVPAYLVASVLLTYGAALGYATLYFQGLRGAAGLQWWLPLLLFVLLVALGVDYSIFLMGRVREEAAERVTADAVAEAVRHTGRIITSAGVILAGTFGALLAAPLRSLAQLGFAAAVGILLDTFVVRALVVPSLAVLLGRHNWWPSSRARAA